MNDLYTISTDRKRRSEQKALTGPTNGNEFNLINIASGAGVIDHLWLACRPDNPNTAWPQYDYTIRVYTDGSSTPDIDIDVGLFFGYTAAHFYPQGNIHTKHWYAHSGGVSSIERVGGYIKLPIPFTNGVRIVVANTTNVGPSKVWSQIDYRLQSDNSGMTIPPYKLKVVGSKWVPSRQSVTATGTATLGTIASGNPGVIVGHSMAGVSPSGDYSYLERPISIYIDGESSPSIKSSGTEDWFGATDYYFSGQSPYSSEGAMGFGTVWSHHHNPFTSLVDFLALNGGYAFTESAILKWEPHSGATVPIDYGTALFYYREV